MALSLEGIVWWYISQQSPGQRWTTCINIWLVKLKLEKNTLVMCFNRARLNSIVLNPGVERIYFWMQKTNICPKYSFSFLPFWWFLWKIIEFLDFQIVITSHFQINHLCSVHQSRSVSSLNTNEHKNTKTLPKQSSPLFTGVCWKKNVPFKASSSGVLTKLGQCTDVTTKVKLRSLCEKFGPTHWRFLPPGKSLHSWIQC